MKTVKTISKSKPNSRSDRIFVGGILPPIEKKKRNQANTWVHFILPSIDK